MSKKRSPDRDDAAADSDHDSDMTVAVIDHQNHYLPATSPRITVPIAAALGISHLEPHPIHPADAEHNAPYVSLAGQPDQPQRNPDRLSLDNDTASFFDRTGRFSLTTSAADQARNHTANIRAVHEFNLSRSVERFGRCACPYYQQMCGTGCIFPPVSGTKYCKPCTRYRDVNSGQDLAQRIKGRVSVCHCQAGINGVLHSP
jgi:hypothetical protein